MDMQSDGELIEKYLKGDESSLNPLIGRYLTPLYRFVYRYVGNEGDAEDLTQEVFVKAWRNLKKFDRKRKFLTWLLAIAKNASIDYLRKKKTVPFSDFENEQGEGIAETVRDESDLPEAIFEKADLKLRVAEVLARLPPHYSQILNLYYSEQLALSEIAEVLGESVNTIKSRHRRGLALLKDLLRE